MQAKALLWWGWWRLAGAHYPACQTPRCNATDDTALRGARCLPTPAVKISRALFNCAANIPAATLKKKKKKKKVSLFLKKKHKRKKLSLKLSQQLLLPVHSGAKASGIQPRQVRSKGRARLNQKQPQRSLKLPYRKQNALLTSWG